jgi:hypothetical protein
VTRRCKYHCRACDSHFTSLRAFDAHRSGPHSGERKCWDPDSNPEAVLRVATDEGVCEADMDWQGNGRHEPVTLWEHISADRARAVFREVLAAQ